MSKKKIPTAVSEWMARNGSIGGKNGSRADKVRAARASHAARRKAKKLFENTSCKPLAK